MTPAKLKFVYSEVIKGFSSINSKDLGVFYIKHLNTIDAADIDSQYDYFYTLAKNQGLPTSDDREREIYTEETWSLEKETQLKNNQLFLSNLNDTKAKIFIEKDKDAIQNQIDEVNRLIKESLLDRKGAIGMVCEDYALNKLNEMYIFKSLYKSPTEILMPEAEFVNLDQEVLHKFVFEYNQNSLNFKEDILKRIALSGFFLNQFFLCDNDVLKFYGNPVIKLSFHQLELFNYGKYFKHIMSESSSKPPDDVMQNPEALIEWYKDSQRTEEILDKGQKDGATALVGASSKDLKRLGLEDNTQQLFKAAEANGGELNMQQFMKLHGHGV